MLLLLLSSPALVLSVEAHKENSPVEVKPAMKVDIWIAAIGRQMDSDDGVGDDELEIKISWFLDHQTHDTASGVTNEIQYNTDNHGGIDHRKEVNIHLYSHIECSPTSNVVVSYSVKEVDTFSDDDMGSAQGDLPGPGEWWTGTGQLNVWFRRTESGVSEPTECTAVCTYPEKSNGPECVCAEGTQREGTSCNIVCPTNFYRVGEHPGVCEPIVCEKGHIAQNNECVCPPGTHETSSGWCGEDTPPVNCPTNPCVPECPPMNGDICPSAASAQFPDGPIAPPQPPNSPLPTQVLSDLPPEALAKALASMSPQIDSQDAASAGWALLP